MIVLLFATWLLVVAGAHMTALFRHRRPGHTSVHDTPPFTLVRPLADDEPGLAERLMQLAGAERVRLCLGEPTDGASRAAHQVVTTLRAASIDADVCLTRARGPNHKAGQLARAICDLGARHGELEELLVFADSDVALGDIDLGAALARLREPSVAAVWFAPVPVGECRTWGDRATLAVLAGSLHAFPLLRTIDREGIVGKLLLVRRDVLQQVGGFAALVHHLGEDVELARRLRRAGWQVVDAEATVPCVLRHTSWDEAIDRFARWVRVVLAQRPRLAPSYPLILAASTPALVIGAALGDRYPILWLTTAGLALTRIGVALRARRAAQRSARADQVLLDVVLADVVLWLAFARALTSRTTRWRARQLRVGSDGLIELAEGAVNHANIASASAPRHERP